MESETTWESIFREDTDFVFFFDFLASAGAPGDPRTKNSENYFYIFYGMPEHEMPDAGTRDAGCRVPGVLLPRGNGFSVLRIFLTAGPPLDGSLKRQLGKCFIRSPCEVLGPV